MNKEILNMEEAAEFFGVSIKTFIKLLKEEKVPARKIGREWRFSRKALIDWLSCGDSQVYSQSETKEFFDEVASSWDKLRKDFYDESIIKKLLGLNYLKSNMKVLDIGAGNGYISLEVSKHVDEVVAVDFSSEMLNELSKKAKKYGIKNIKLLESDGCNIPMPDDTIDLVCANMYLHHIKNPSSAAVEMYRLLKPGGVVFVADLDQHKNKKFQNEMHDLWTGFSAEAFKGIFLKAGFQSIKIDTITTNNKININILSAIK